MLIAAFHTGDGSQSSAPDFHASLGLVPRECQSCYTNCIHSVLYLLTSLLGTWRSESILSCRSCHVTSSVFESLSHVVPRSPTMGRKKNRDCDRSGLHRNCCGLAGSSLQLFFPQQSLLGGLSSLHSHRRMAQAIVLSSALAAPLGRWAAVSRACWRGCRWWPRWRVSGQQRSGVRRQGAGGEGG